MSNNKTLPEAFKRFDSLPNTAFVRLPVVCELYGVSAATVWRMVAAGTLRTHKLTPRTTTFNVGELRDALVTETKPICKSKACDESQMSHQNENNKSPMQELAKENNNGQS